MSDVVRAGENERGPFGTSFSMGSVSPMEDSDTESHLASQVQVPDQGPHLIRTKDEK